MPAVREDGVGVEGLREEVFELEGCGVEETHGWEEWIGSFDFDVLMGGGGFSAGWREGEME